MRARQSTAAGLAIPFGHLPSDSPSLGYSSLYQIPSELVFFRISLRLTAASENRWNEVMGEGAMRYDASHITVLTGPEAVRKRPGMYVGSTSTRGLHNMVFEVAAWAVDEVLAGRAGHVDVTLTADEAVEVAHDGPGVPFEDGEEPGMEKRLTLMWAGTESAGRRGALVGRFGMGLFVPNALSSRLTAQVRRDGTRWVQEYARGVPAGPPSAAGQAEGSGTSLTFRPDAEIFAIVQCSFDDLADRLRELAFLDHGLDITLTDQRPRPPRAERLCFPGGTKDYVALLDTQLGTPVHPDVIGFELEARRMAGTMEVALCWHATTRGAAFQLRQQPAHTAGRHPRSGLPRRRGGRVHRLRPPSRTATDSSRRGPGADRPGSDRRGSGQARRPRARRRHAGGPRQRRRAQLRCRGRPRPPHRMARTPPRHGSSPRPPRPLAHSRRLTSPSQPADRVEPGASP